MDLRKISVLLSSKRKESKGWDTTVCYDIHIKCISQCLVFRLQNFFIASEFVGKAKSQRSKA